MSKPSEEFEQAYDNFLAGVDVDTTMLDCAEFMFNAGRESILQTKEILPPLPQPTIYGESICCGNFTTGGEYMGQQENICCGRFEESTPDYYTAGQVYHYAMRVLAGHIATLKAPAAAINEQLLEVIETAANNLGEFAGQMETQQKADQITAYANELFAATEAAKKGGV